MKSEHEGIIFKTVKGEGLAVDVEPADCEALEGVDRFGVKDGNFIIFIFLKVLHTSGADIKLDRRKGATWSRAVCELSHVGLTFVVFEASREDVARGAEFINVEKDEFTNGGVDDVLRDEEGLTGVGGPGGAGDGGGEGGGEGEAEDV